DGNINAQGKDIAKTGGFVETSGHYLSIGNDAAVEAKEWLLDPDNVTISNGNDDQSQLKDDRGDSPNKILADNKHTVNNKTLSTALAKGIGVNISAKKKVNVTADINVHNGTLTLHSEQGGVEINGDITSEQNGNLTIKAGSWVDVHKNITIGTGFLNITAGGSVAFEKAGGDKGRAASDAKIVAQGVITAGSGQDFRFNNVSLNGTGRGLKFITAKGNKGNFSAKFDGVLNISGNISINHTANNQLSYFHRQGYTYWNLTQLNVDSDSSFSLTSIKDAIKVGGYDNAKDKKTQEGLVLHEIPFSM
ncbi:TPA: adhesin, partial [Haemophilus influenzae]